MSTLADIYGPDEMSDYGPEYLEEGDQLAGAASAVKALYKWAPERWVHPNPGRPNAISEALNQLSNSGRLKQAYGIDPDLPALKYIMDPRLKDPQLWGLDLDRYIGDGHHRAMTTGMLQVPVKGEELVLGAMKDGRIRAIDSKGFPMGVVVDKNVKHHGIQTDVDVVDNAVWTPSDAALQGDAMAKFYDPEIDYIDLMKQYTDNGANAERASNLPTEFPWFGTESYSEMSHGINRAEKGANNAWDEIGSSNSIKPLSTSIMEEAQYLNPAPKKSFVTALDEVRGSGNPQLKWVAEQTSKDKSIVQPTTKFSDEGARIMLLDGSKLSDLLNEQLASSGYMPGWKRRPGTSFFEKMQP